MDREFQNRETCVRFLRSHFETSIGSDNAAAFADEVADLSLRDVHEAPEPSPDDFELLVPGARWVIKDTDLALFNSIVDSVKAGVPAGLLTGSATAGVLLGSALGVAVIVLKTAHRALKRGARLTPLQYDLLVALRAAAPSGISRHDLPERVRAIRRGKADNAVLSDNEIDSLLNELMKFALPDGSVASFVSTDAKGILRAQDV
jgi:hypothetical protein